MENEIVDKMLAVQETAKQDEHYLSILEEYRVMDKRFLEALEEMSPEHRQIVMDYMGAVHAANQRMVELALLWREKC